MDCQSQVEVVAPTDKKALLHSKKNGDGESGIPCALRWGRTCGESDWDDLTRRLHRLRRQGAEDHGRYQGMPLSASSSCSTIEARREHFHVGPASGAPSSLNDSGGVKGSHARPPPEEGYGPFMLHVPLARADAMGIRRVPPGAPTWFASLNNCKFATVVWIRQTPGHPSLNRATPGSKDLCDFLDEGIWKSAVTSICRIAS